MQKVTCTVLLIVFECLFVYLLHSPVNFKLQMKYCNTFCPLSTCYCQDYAYLSCLQEAPPPLSLLLLYAHSKIMIFVINGRLSHRRTRVTTHQSEFVNNKPLGGRAVNYTLQAFRASPPLPPSAPVIHCHMPGMQATTYCHMPGMQALTDSHKQGMQATTDCHMPGMQATTYCHINGQPSYNRLPHAGHACFNRVPHTGHASYNILLHAGHAGFTRVSHAGHASYMPILQALTDCHITGKDASTDSQKPGMQATDCHGTFKLQIQQKTGKASCSTCGL